MSYKKAAQILPDELIRQIQQYVDGEAIYIPRSDERRRAWGDSTVTRRELRDRNESIYREYLGGATMAALAQRYFLSLECVSKREIRKFEWIFRQFKEEIRRLSSAKSRIDDAEMAQKPPKLRIKEFLRHILKSIQRIICTLRRQGA